MACPSLPEGWAFKMLPSRCSVIKMGGMGGAQAGCLMLAMVMAGGCCSVSTHMDFGHFWVLAGNVG